MFEMLSNDRRANLKRRFISHIDKTPGHGPKGECWLWASKRRKDGYGLFKVGNWRIRAHRAGYELLVGLFNEELFILHSCDNPPCVNPDHMRPGTSEDNIADMLSRKRNRFAFGGRRPQAKLTETQVLEIQSLIENGGSNISIATRFSVRDTAISRIRLGQSWAYITHLPLTGTPRR